MKLGEHVSECLEVSAGGDVSVPGSPCKAAGALVATAENTAPSGENHLSHQQQTDGIAGMAAKKRVADAVDKKKSDKKRSLKRL
jgi:hypothetical protein